MTEPSLECPSTWREYNTSGGVRACGRPDTDGGSCPSTSYNISHQYSRVCGRVIGYQFGSPDAFTRVSRNGIDVDGINIIYGTSTNHIWGYVAGVSEAKNYIHPYNKCPCNSFRTQGRPPPFIGDNYYCEPGNTMKWFRHQFYSHDKLWDWQQCEGTCCTTSKSPPWFKVHLYAKTSDAIKVQICCDSYRTTRAIRTVSIISIPLTTKEQNTLLQ